MIPQIYLRRGPDDGLTEDQSDACRNWLARNCYAAPRVWEDGEDGDTMQRDLLLEDVTGGLARLVVVWSLDHLGPTRDEAMRVAGRLLSVLADLVVISPPMDLRGRTELSVAQRMAIQAVVDFVPLVEPPHRNAGGRPRTEYTPEQVEMAHNHLKSHGRSKCGDLAKATGVTPRQAARLLANEAEVLRASAVIALSPAMARFVEAAAEAYDCTVIHAGGTEPARFESPATQSLWERWKADPAEDDQPTTETPAP